jgi:uncharacterized protein YdeI (YjbR/CyaY-like superfamily)
MPAIAILGATRKLLRLPRAVRTLDMTIMPTRVSEVDHYIAKAAPFARPVLQYLRDVMHEGAPGVVEAMKWSRPFFVYQGVILGNVAAFKEHCSMGLWGKEIADVIRQSSAAQGDGMGSFGKIKCLEDLPSKRKLVEYVKLAAKAIDDGQRTKAWSRSKVAKKEVAVPVALEMALSKSRLTAKFDAMSQSCRREYCEWIAEAKREETRAKRIATALEWIAEGKSRNWRYERKTA